MQVGFFYKNTLFVDLNILLQLHCAPVWSPYLVSQPRPEQMMNSELGRETLCSLLHARALPASLPQQHGEATEISVTQTCLSQYWFYYSLGFLPFQTSMFVNIIIYWVDVWAFAKICETKILGCRKVIERRIRESCTFFPGFFLLGFYFFHTFCIVSFLTMSGGLITDKNWTVILKIVCVFTAFQWLSCTRNENPNFYPYNSTIPPYLKSMSGTNSFRFDSFAHPSFVYRNVWIISCLHPDLAAECCSGTSHCNTNPSCTYSVLLISLKSHCKLFSFLHF